MHILYIHGLDSEPNPFRISQLETAGHVVSALHLDYRTEPDSYKILRDHCRNHQVEFIVGSSLGGFLGFWLGKELGINSLLFNPAMPNLETDEAGIDPNFEDQPQNRWVVIGAEDDTVNPHQNWEYFRKLSYPGQKVLMCQWLGHQIDPDTFVEMATWSGLI